MLGSWRIAPRDRWRSYSRDWQFTWFNLLLMFSSINCSFIDFDFCKKDFIHTYKRKKSFGSNWNWILTDFYVIIFFPAKQLIIYCISLVQWVQLSSVIKLTNLINQTHWNVPLQISSITEPIKQQSKVCVDCVGLIIGLISFDDHTVKCEILTWTISWTVKEIENFNQYQNS